MLALTFAMGFRWQDVAEGRFHITHLKLKRMGCSPKEDFFQMITCFFATADG
jgi:hypothetical protein